MTKTDKQAEYRAVWERRGRMLDFDVATRVMGWRIKSVGAGHGGWTPGYSYWEGEGARAVMERLGMPQLTFFADQWRPSTDLNACALAEARVVALGLGERYVRALSEEFGNVVPAHNLPLICAPAQTRCRAMLRALEASGADP